MKHTETKYNPSPHDKALSNLMVTKDGKLRYREPAIKQILQTTIKMTPFMAWYVFIGMLAVLLMSVWGLAHPEIAITRSSKIEAYLLLMAFSLISLLAMIWLATFLARKKIIDKEN